LLLADQQNAMAHYFKDILKNEAMKIALAVGKIDKEPVKGLVNYYLAYYCDKLPA